MPPDSIDQRTKIALAAIRRNFEDASDEFGAALFVSHHLEEVAASFWEKHLRSRSPEPSRVLNLLILRSHWGGEDEMGNFDFTLPDEATDYVISVSFDDAGEVEAVTMES